MFAASSAAGATLQPVARILFIICSVQIIVTSCQNAYFDGPFVDKYYPDDQCPYIDGGQVRSVEECLDKCLSHRGPHACTAVDYVVSDNVCRLHACPLPVPPPAGDAPGVNAYSLKPDLFDGPYVGKYYPWDQCPYVEGGQVQSVEVCMDWCLSHRGPQTCTAFDYRVSANWCIILACALPVPLPAGDWSDVNAYILKTGTTNQTISATPSPKDPLEHLKKSGCKAVKGTCQRKTDICEGELKVGGKWCKKSKKYGCCIPPKENVCELQHDIGKGSKSFTRFYYDVNWGQCLKFIWRGKGGNNNRFTTWEECTERCGYRPYESSVAQSEPNNTYLVKGAGRCNDDYDTWIPQLDKKSYKDAITHCTSMSSPKQLACPLNEDTFSKWLKTQNAKDFWFAGQQGQFQHFNYVYWADGYEIKRYLKKEQMNLWSEPNPIYPSTPGCVKGNRLLSIEDCNNTYLFFCSN